MPVTTHIKHASRWCRRGSSKVMLKRAVWYRLQRVQLVANWLTIFIALPRTMDRSNAKLGEGVKRIFSNLLAVFHVRKLSTQWKCVSNYCLQQHTLFVHTRMNSLLPCPNNCYCGPVTCVGACHCILICVYVLNTEIQCGYNVCMCRLSVSMCQCLSEYIYVSGTHKQYS